MRVAILTNAYPPGHTGGAAQIAAQQVEILQAAGHEVKIWCPQVPWLNKQPWVRLIEHIKDLRAQPAWVDDIVAWKPDVLITHNLTGCGFGTPRAIQRHDISWIHWLHDIQLFEPSGQLYRLRPITFWQLGWSLARSLVFGVPNHVVSPTFWLLSEHRKHFILKDFGKVPGIVLPNPAPPSQPVPRSHIHQPNVRLLFVGHVSYAKGSELLLRLVKKLTIPFELHIVGEGPDLPKLLAASSSVIPHGPLDRKGVLAQMIDSDILLVPSHVHENQPTVILEAASVGLPVIASNREGIMETLDAATANMVCAPKNVHAWCEAIQRLVDDAAIYQHQAHLMERLAEAHDPEVYRQKFLDLVTSKR